LKRKGGGKEKKRKEKRKKNPTPKRYVARTVVKLLLNPPIKVEGISGPLNRNFDQIKVPPIALKGFHLYVLDDTNKRKDGNIVGGLTIVSKVRHYVGNGIWPV